MKQTDQKTLSQVKHYGLSTEPALIMHIDLNSAFASAEQQAWPHLRGRPIGVTNRLSRECCVIAASYEAKALGIKVGMRRSEAMSLCPDFVMLETDPSKYRFMYLNLLKIMGDYSDRIKMKSIDEGVIDFHGTTCVNSRSLTDIGHEIKTRMKELSGQWMRTNVGIGPNRFLAKMAAGLHKPDGLDLVDYRNVVDMYAGLRLEDLTGISHGYGTRLRSWGIGTPLEFLAADRTFLQKQVFRSINGLHWHNRLRGYETDDYSTNLSMVGRQWVVRQSHDNQAYLRSCLHYLTETVGLKLRYRRSAARGVCVWLNFSAGGGWQGKTTIADPVYADRDIWQQVDALFDARPKGRKVSCIGIYLYHIQPSVRSQLALFEDAPKLDDLTRSTDAINDFYGNFTIHSADTLEGTRNVKQKIPFGSTEYFDLLLKRA